MSYYRKYRPQRVGELDLVGVRDAFLKILASGSFASAYLFAGPKGTGKTSSARILAKIVNCEVNRAHERRSEKATNLLEEPCGKCSSCKAITGGSSLAVIEMDAASNRGIDDIRTLRERVALMPAEAPFAVYIIDEVHMLTPEAFNALLKTLEEPPKHAIFVLCTTEKHKVPETIVSRCMTVDFTKATSEEIIGSLKKAVAGEGLKIETEVLEAIARRSDGSFRDAMKVLEQSAQGGNEVSMEAVDKLTGHGAEYNPNPIIEALLKFDYRTGLKELAAKEAAGVDMGIFGKRLISRLRVLVVDEAEKSKTDLDSIAVMVKLTEKMTEAVVKIKNSPIPVLPLELAVVEWGLSESNSVAPIDKKVPPISITRVVQDASISSVEVRPVAVKLIEPTTAIVKEKWEEIMKQVRPYNHSLEALLRAARPLGISGKVLTVEVFYKFHKEQLELDRHLKIMEQIIHQSLGNNLRLSYVLADRAKKAAQTEDEAIDNVSGAVKDEKVAQAAEEIFG